MSEAKVEQREWKCLCGETNGGHRTLCGFCDCERKFGEERATLPPQPDVALAGELGPVEIVEQWHQEWLDENGKHWGDEIGWHTAREIARRLAALRGSGARGEVGKLDGVECLSINQGSSVVVDFDDKDAAFAFYNEVQARALKEPKP